MSWIFDNIGLIVFAVIAFSVVRKIRAFLQRAEMETERRAASRQTASYDPEAARRVQEIQEEIRRKIAERRGGHQPTVSVPGAELREESPPYIPPARTAPLDPFGGPMKKVLDQFERRLQPNPPVVKHSREAHAAQLVRQEELAEELRMLEESRVAAQRRAAQAAAASRTEAASERGMLTASRGSLLADLHDPQSLRRAFVLREVLGAPVGLR